MYPAIHSFHIPVMGLAYTIDSPAKVAQFGISSVVSIIEDRLVEMMRKYYYSVLNEEYKPIPIKEEDYRAKRVTDYLNLLNRIVTKQIETLRSSAFQAGSDIVKYFEMLPDESPLKHVYLRMLSAVDKDEQEALQRYLKQKIKPGCIDVNIMTKLDKNNYDDQGQEIKDGSDALASLRGYANSNLTNSSIVLSAGMNPRLFNYMEKLTAFDANENGEFDKRIIIKVSDYRSALIQGKYLAKKGIWVSEFRIESGLNCGGHAFATDGFLIGPILEEFKTKREELKNELYRLYSAARIEKGKAAVAPHPMYITVQGGIGTAEEDRFLRSQYNVDSTGWGTPFLLCPEATTIDMPTLSLLAKADEGDVELSKNSPLGVRFHYLKNTSSATEKQKRIDDDAPGSACTEKHLISSTEFSTTPLCTASKKYQLLKIEQLKSLNLPGAEYQQKAKEVHDKECLCVGLSNSASIVYKQPFVKHSKSVTICPGPNIVFFDKVVTLREMIDHIYGRKSVLRKDKQRPHVFINELKLYINYMIEQTAFLEPSLKQIQYWSKFAENLLQGIRYYTQLPLAIDETFTLALEEAECKIKEITAMLQPLSEATHSA